PTDDTARVVFEHSRTHLEGYKRIRRLQFTDLPKTISGKIRRAELRKGECDNGPSVDFPGAFRDDALRSRSRHRRPIASVRSHAPRCASRTRPSPDEAVELLGSPRRTVVEVAVGQDLRFRGRETSDETAGAGEDAAGDPVG